MITNEKGHKVARLICVTGENNNKYYNMTQTSADTFHAEWGRVDVTKSEQDYPMRDWVRIYRDKTKESKKPKPYTDVTHLMAEKTSSSNGDTASSSSIFHAKREKDSRSFVEMIMGFAKASVEENYTVSANKVTRQQLDEAQGVLNYISDLLMKVDSGNSITVQNVNDKLIELYQIIPRRMKNVQEYLLHRITGESGKGKFELLSGNLKKTDLKDAKELFSKEQDQLDVMAGQVAAIVDDTAPKGKSTDSDLLHTLGLEILPCSSAELKMISSKMGPNKDQLVRAFRTHNEKSEGKFQKWVAAKDEKKSDVLWHGSRNENWWSIFQQSLKVRPSNAVLTGSMFGYGVYFADKAQKSIGYTSLDNSYWAGGNAKKAILGLYEIHQGKQMVIERHQNDHCSLDESKMKKKGYDSVFAKGGYDLRNNEFIVYNEAQSTIRYFVEIRK